MPAVMTAKKTHITLATLLVAALLLATTGCQQQATSSLSMPTPPTPSQFVLVNQSTLPGFYGVCTLDGELLNYKIRSAQYVERPRLKEGYHRLECHAEALSLQLSFDCDHDFRVYGDEPVYISLSGRTVPGACTIKRLSMLPEDFGSQYHPANERL